MGRDSRVGPRRARRDRGDLLGIPGGAPALVGGPGSEQSDLGPRAPVRAVAVPLGQCAAHAWHRFLAPRPAVMGGPRRGPGPADPYRSGVADCRDPGTPSTAV